MCDGAWHIRDVFIGGRRTFSETNIRIVGVTFTGWEMEAVAARYVVIMTDLLLNLIQSENLLVVDGGLANIDMFAAMLT